MAAALARGSPLALTQAYATNNDYRLAKLAREMLSEVDLRMLKIHELGSADGGTLELLQRQKPARVFQPARVCHRPDDDLKPDHTPDPKSSPQQQGSRPAGPFSKLPNKAPGERPFSTPHLGEKLPTPSLRSTSYLDIVTRRSSELELLPDKQLSVPWGCDADGRLSRGSSTKTASPPPIHSFPPLPAAISTRLSRPYSYLDTATRAELRRLNSSSVPGGEEDCDSEGEIDDVLDVIDQWTVKRQWGSDQWGSDQWTVKQRVNEGSGSTSRGEMGSGRVAQCGAARIVPPRAKGEESISDQGDGASKRPPPGAAPVPSRAAAPPLPPPPPACGSSPSLPPPRMIRRSSSRESVSPPLGQPAAPPPRMVPAGGTLSQVEEGTLVHLESEAARLRAAAHARQAAAAVAEAEAEGEGERQWQVAEERRVAVAAAVAVAEAEAARGQRRRLAQAQRDAASAAAVEVEREEVRRRRLGVARREAEEAEAEVAEAEMRQQKIAQVCLLWLPTTMATCYGFLLWLLAMVSYYGYRVLWLLTMAAEDVQAIAARPRTANTLPPLQPGHVRLQPDRISVQVRAACEATAAAEWEAAQRQMWSAAAVRSGGGGGGAADMEAAAAGERETAQRRRLAVARHQARETNAEAEMVAQRREVTRARRGAEEVAAMAAARAWEKDLSARLHGQKVPWLFAAHAATRRSGMSQHSLERTSHD